MKSRFLHLLASVLLITTFAGNLFAANPKREMRSTWLTLVSNIDWPSTKGTSASAQAAQKQELIAYLDNLEELNMTSTCLHIRTMGDAAYPSEYAPWSSYISGTRGVSPGWDPLAFFVEECHKRGIEFHAWMNPYRVTTNVAKSLEDIAKDSETKEEYVVYRALYEDRKQIVVTRTSSTNIGLSMLATISAYDMGFENLETTLNL